MLLLSSLTEMLCINSNWHSNSTDLHRKPFHSYLLNHKQSLSISQPHHQIIPITIQDAIISKCQKLYFMFPYVPPFGLSLIYLSLLKAKTEAKEENGWEEEQNALSSWKEVMIQISPFHDSSSLGCSQQSCVCHVFDDDHPLSTAHDFQGSASLLLLFMCALWSALQVRRLGPQFTENPAAIYCKG